MTKTTKRRTQHTQWEDTAGVAKDNLATFIVALLMDLYHTQFPTSKNSKGGADNLRCSKCLVVSSHSSTLTCLLVCTEKTRRCSNITLSFLSAAQSLSHALVLARLHTPVVGLWLSFTSNTVEQWKVAMVICRQSGGYRYSTNNNTPFLVLSKKKSHTADTNKT